MTDSIDDLISKIGNLEDGYRKRGGIPVKMVVTEIPANNDKIYDIFQPVLGLIPTYPRFGAHHTAIIVGVHPFQYTLVIIYLHLTKLNLFFYDQAVVFGME